MNVDDAHDKNVKTLTNNLFPRSRSHTSVLALTLISKNHTAFTKSIEQKTPTALIKSKRNRPVPKKELR